MNLSQVGEALTKPKYITDMGESFDLVDPDSGETIGSLARFGVWAWDERKAAYQVIAVGNDAEQLKADHGITSDPVRMKHRPQ